LALASTCAPSAPGPPPSRTAQLLSEPRWKQQVARLRAEFDAYRPYEIIAAYLSNRASHAYTDSPVYGETS
jgi:hypothetical protein